MDLWYMLLGTVMVALFFGTLPFFTACTRWEGTGSVYRFNHTTGEGQVLPAWETGKRIRSAIMWGVYALALEALGGLGLWFFLNASLKPMNTLATLGVVFGMFASLGLPIRGIYWLDDHARQRP